MVEKKVESVSNILLLLAVGLLIAMVVKVKLEQKNSVEAAKDRYEQMISRGQVVTLTNDILEEDYEKYVKDAQKAKELLPLFLGFVGVFLGFIIIRMLIGVIFSVVERKGIMNFVGNIVVALLFVGMLVGGYTLVKDKVLPEIDKNFPENEAHYFFEYKLADAKKEVVTEAAPPSDDASSRSKTYYYLITDEGRQISVREEVFDRFREPGVYYAGRTDATIFSLYEGKYFQLKDK